MYGTVKAQCMLPDDTARVAIGGFGHDSTRVVGRHHSARACYISLSLPGSAAISPAAICRGTALLHRP